MSDQRLLQHELVSHPDLTHARPGDWIVIEFPGNATRRGRIIKVYGSGQHLHFDVHWGARQSSLLYPDPEHTEITRLRPDAD